MKKLLAAITLLVSLYSATYASLSFSSDTQRVDYVGTLQIHDGTHSKGWLAVWVYADNDTQRTGVVNLTGGGEYFLNWRGDQANDPFECGRQRGATYASANANATSFTSWGINKWVFIVCQWDTSTSGNNKMYIGDLSTPPAEPSAYTSQSNGSGIVNGANGDLRVGNSVADTAREWRGRIAITMVFSGVPTADQVIAQWGIRCRPHKSAVFFSHLGWNGTGTQVDYSGGVATGTLTGSPTLADHLPCNSIWGY